MIRVDHKKSSNTDEKILNYTTLIGIGLIIAYYLLLLTFPELPPDLMMILQVEGKGRGGVLMGYYVSS